MMKLVFLGLLLTISLDGATYMAKVQTSGGGVGRNLAEALSKINRSCSFLSAIGSDPHGKYLQSLLPKECHEQYFVDVNKSTANCSVIFDKFGDFKLMVGDMEVHASITPEFVMKNEHLIKGAPITIVDANLSLPTMERIFEICQKYKKPVFFEPTDLRIAAKPFTIANAKLLQQTIKFMTPNLYELREIAKQFGSQNINSASLDDLSLAEIKTEIIDLASSLSSSIDNIIVTLGHYGVATFTKRSANSAYFCRNTNYIESKTGDILQGRLYPGRKIPELVNVSGAGDSFSSGFISAMIRNLPEAICVNVGLEAAVKSLAAQSAIPEEYFEESHEVWRIEAKYEEIL